jgi:hypothetical protein
MLIRKHDKSRTPELEDSSTGRAGRHYFDLELA